MVAVRNLFINRIYDSDALRVYHLLGGGYTYIALAYPTMVVSLGNVLCSTLFLVSVPNALFVGFVLPGALGHLVGFTRRAAVGRTVGFAGLVCVLGAPCFAGRLTVRRAVGFAGGLTVCGSPCFAMGRAVTRAACIGGAVPGAGGVADNSGIFMMLALGSGL